MRLQPLRCLLCAVVALLCILAVACTAGDGTPAQTTGVTHDTTDDVEHDTAEDTAASTAPDTDSGEFDTTPLTPTVREDRFPDYREYEAVVTDTADAVEEVPAAAVSYDVPMAEEKDGELLEAAARVGVLDQAYPLAIRVSTTFVTDGEQAYAVTDLLGNVVYSGTLRGKAGETVCATRGIKDHPTGYFQLTVGEERYAYVVTPPLQERHLTDSPFAADLAAYYLLKNTEDVYSIAAAARLMGITWVRDRAKWTHYEKKPGVYDFSVTEAVYKEIDRAGLNLLTMLQLTPLWMRDYMNVVESGGSRPGGFYDTQLEAYRLTKALAEYYKGIVDAWELENEPDQGLVDPAEIYASWYKAAALGVYDADPNAILSFGGLCHPNSQDDYMHLLLRNDVMRYSSIFNYHQHVIQGNGIPNYAELSMVKDTVSSLALYGVSDKPVWITESGMRIDQKTDANLRGQAPYIVTSTVQSLALGTEKHFWFVLSPYSESGDFGSFSTSLSPYPIIAAEAVMTDVLGEAVYLGELSDLPEDAYGYLFRNGKRAVSVIWSSAGSDGYSFETAGPVIVTDMMGRETFMTPVDGRITVEIGGDPIYITYSNPPASYYQQSFARPEAEPIEITEADRVVITPEFDSYRAQDRVDGHVIADGTQIRVRVTNFNSYAVTGTVSVTVPGFTVEGCDESLTVEPFADGILTLTLKKTSNKGINDFVTFVGTFNGQSTAKAAIHVRTEASEGESSLAFRSMVSGKHYPASELSSIAVVARNITGEFEVRLNEERYDNFVAEGKNLRIDLSDIRPGKYILTVGIRTEGGDYIFCQKTLWYDGTEFTVR